MARFLVLYDKTMPVKTPADIYVIEAIRKERMAQKGFIGMAESPKYDIKYNVNHINEIARFLGCSPRDFMPEKPL